MKQTKPRKIKTKHQVLFDKCTRLWSEIVLTRAGRVSEISGEYGNQPHHARGKSTNRLRFATDGGICLTVQEHLYGIHSPDPRKSRELQEKIDAALIAREGKGILEKLELMANTYKADLFSISLDLEKQLKELKK